MTKYVMRRAMSDEDVAREIKALREAGRKLRAKPGAARAFLIKLGIIKKTGGLTKRYGG